MGYTKNILLYILLHFDGGIDINRLYNIIYVIYKSYLSKYGLFIINDTFVATNNGPVPRNTLNLIHTSFNDSMTIVDDCICATKRPDMDYISVAEEQEIDSVIDSYWSDETGFINECKDSAHTKALTTETKELSVEDIARAGGATDDLIQYIQMKIDIYNLLEYEETEEKSKPGHFHKKLKKFKKYADKTAKQIK